jgi:hypothetical protein
MKSDTGDRYQLLKKSFGPKDELAALPMLA